MSLDQLVGLGLTAVPYGINNYGKVAHPVKRKVRRIRGREDQEQNSDAMVHGGWKPDDRGLVLKRRSEVQSDEEIVEHIPRANRQALVRRTSSMDRGNYDYDRSDGRYDRRMGAYRGGGAAAAGAAGAGYDSDSEGSVPPRSRAGRGRAKSTQARSKRSSSSSSSSDLGSSTDDERRVKKAQRKKWITGALAGVATIHAAAKVYTSLESHDKRIEQVRTGEISPEEAHKKQTASRWQDAAAVGIAALGIKGAVSEWGEMQEQQHEHQEIMKSREERHKKRMERERKRAKDNASRNGDRR